MSLTNPGPPADQPCPDDSSGRHCPCWYDGYRCCGCDAPPLPADDPVTGDAS